QESLLAHLFHLDQKLNHKHLATCDYKKIKEFSLDDLNSLNCTQLLKPEKIKLSRSRLKNQSLK
ncbi:MAG: hypothetical protein EBU93_07195, partial [Chlamydiae bacterium]|nr:hypothetical protein [Chlamydiota bacterium]